MARCCFGTETTEDEHEPAAQSGLAPRSKRKCRDVFCCLLFLVYWIGMVVVAIVAIRSGKPLSLVYGRDHTGAICGDGDLAALKYTAYPRLDEDMLAAMSQGVALSDVSFFGVCVVTCPLAGDSVCTADNSTNTRSSSTRKCWTQALPTTPLLFRCLPVETRNETILSETCVDPVGADPACTLAKFTAQGCATICRSKRVESRVVETGATTTNPIMAQLQGYVSVLARLVGDTRSAAPLILLVGGGGALLLGLLWLVVLQYLAGCMVWLTCLLVVISLVLMSMFCSVRSGIITSEALSFLNGTDTSATTSTMAIDTTALQASADDTTRLQFEVAAYVMWGLTALVMLVLVAMGKRIHLAIAIIRESSRAIRKLPLLLLWPLVPTALFTALVVYAIAIAAYLMSASDLAGSVTTLTQVASAATAAATGTGSSSDTTDAFTIQTVPSDTLQRLLLAFHLFGFLWTNQLIQAISICTIAGAVAQYYWSEPDAHGRRTLEARFPIARALSYVLRFSLGSLCFGSFVIALVQFLRVMLEYIDQQTKDLQKTNRAVKVLFLAVRCCMWCFEKCLKFLSRNAYILIAMRGSSFCAASVASFKLIFHNAARLAVVNSISFFLLALVKFTITLSVGGVVFLVLAKQDTISSSSTMALLGENPVTSPMAPVLVSCILAWLVASAFINVYDAAIDTILLCFCEDTALNSETASNYMSDELRRLMGGHEGKHTVVVVASRASKSDQQSALAGDGTNTVQATTSDI